jgi:hypothetical protein
MSAAALERVITTMAGPHARPRPDQVTAVEALVEHRRRVLVVQATGWGKSAVYWAATAALRKAEGGPTLVRDAGSGGRYTGRSSATRPESTRIEYDQPIRSAITVAGIVGVACNNSRIRGSTASTTDSRGGRR